MCEWSEKQIKYTSVFIAVLWGGGEGKPDWSFYSTAKMAKLQYMT
jgi:hypothetical protein